MITTSEQIEKEFIADFNSLMAKYGAFVKIMADTRGYSFTVVIIPAKYIDENNGHESASIDLESFI